MNKIIFVLLISTLVMFATTVNFREIKLIEALKLETYRDGNISYDKTKTVIKYKDGKTITKVGNGLTVHNAKNELLTTMDLTKKPELSMYFYLTKALFLKDFKILEENFEIIKLSNKKYKFKPKGETKNVVSGIELSLKENSFVEFFIIKFKNKDSLKIEAK